MFQRGAAPRGGGEVRVSPLFRQETDNVRALARIEPISSAAYVRDVLPDTFPMWGDGRTFERYVADFRAVAGSAYGKRRQFTVGIVEGGRIVSSCKNYERELRWNGVSLRATGIGAVYTPEDLRGRGYASLMLGALLDAERDAGRDVAFLYADIHPAFYERLGFIALPSRQFTLRASALDGSHAGAKPLESGDWAGVRRCFENMDRRRAWSFRRTPLVWDWLRARWGAPPADGAQPVQLAIKRGRATIAYAIGRRVLREDTFVIDDFAFEDEGRALVPALLRAAAGDLRRVGGWLPPPVARDVLPRPSVRSRKTAALMLVPLSAQARAWWSECREETLANRADPCWNADHV
jgi:GNAT superfamily N-acetyltransferase